MGMRIPRPSRRRTWHPRPPRPPPSRPPRQQIAWRSPSPTPPASTGNLWIPDLPGPDRHRDHGQSLGALRRRTRHRLLRRRGRRAHPVRQAHRPPVPRLLPRHRPPEPRDVPALRRRREALRRQDRVHLPRRRRRDQARQRQRHVLILRRRPQGMLRRSQSSATATKTRYPQRVGHRPAQGPEPRHEDGGPGGPGGPSLRGRVGRSRIADQVQPADQRDFARECGTSSASWARR